MGVIVYFDGHHMKLAFNVSVCCVSVDVSTGYPAMSE